MPVAHWIHKKHGYKALNCIANGKCMNVGNALRKAKRGGITQTDLTADECKAGIEVCRQRLDTMTSQSMGLWKVHLRDCLVKSKSMTDKCKYQDILQIIRREEQKSTWRAIKQVVNNHKPGAITKVQWELDTKTIDVTDQDDMINEIQTVREQRFAVGFLANTNCALQLVSGQQEILDDVDELTRLIIDKMRILWKSKGHKRFKTFQIMANDFRHYWHKVKESTSSSYSNIHFGQYKAAAQSNLLSTYLADKLSVVGSYGCPPTQWATGLQVMLEKVAGVAMVSKLRAILLMEAVYNFFNKWVFGYHAINQLYSDGFIPGDQYSQKECTAEDARLDSRFTMDMSRQLRTPLALVSVDADKCYDRINHIMMSLALLAVCGSQGLISALLQPIQMMKFYQQTAFGDSRTFMGGMA